MGFACAAARIRRKNSTVTLVEVPRLADPFRPSLANRTPMQLRRLALLALPCALLLPACATTKPRPYQERLDEFMRPWEELKRQKAELWRQGWEAQEFKFDAGTVTVSHWELTGVPGDVYLQARLTYRNTTDRVMHTAFVWVDVLDADENVVGSAAARLFNPVGYPFWPGDSYTTVIRTATNDAHLDPRGWNWTIACEGQIERDPGTRPVIIDRDLEERRASLASRPSWYRGAGYKGAPLVPTFGGGSLPAGLDGPHVPGNNHWR